TPSLCVRARRCTSSRFPRSQRPAIRSRISGSRACSQWPVQSNEKPSITSVRQSPPTRSSASSSVHALPSSRAHARPARPPPITMALPPRRISTRLYHESPAVSLARQQADASVTSGRRRVKISCPTCAAAYELDDSRVPPAGLDDAAVPPPPPPPDDPFAAIDAGTPAPPAPPPEAAATPPPPPPDDDEFAVEPQRRDEFAVEPRRLQTAPKANEEPMNF